MASEMEELFEAVILDHNHAPRNFRRLEPRSHVAHAYNPLCGDRYEIHLDVEGGRVKAIGFTGNGCAVSKASISIMTTKLSGRPIDSAREFLDSLRQLLESHGTPDERELGDLGVFGVVRGAPTRVKCALLGWDSVVTELESSNVNEV